MSFWRLGDVPVPPIFASGGAAESGSIGSGGCAVVTHANYSTVIITYSRVRGTPHPHPREIVRRCYIGVVYRLTYCIARVFFPVSLAPLLRPSDFVAGCWMQCNMAGGDTHVMKILVI